MVTAQSSGEKKYVVSSLTSTQFKMLSSFSHTCIDGKAASSHGEREDKKERKRR